jgi:PAS domain S-box-containing protein
MSQQQQLAEQIFAGNSEMAILMRSLDWTTTSLGAIATWSQSLRTAVNICLNSRFPMVIWWGQELVLLYNDAWRAIPGNRHPKALSSPGKAIFSESWHIIGPQLKSVLETGTATWEDDLLIPVLRSGYLEEAYYTYSYSPIFTETGEVEGVFTAVAETTHRVLGERRLATLKDLAAQSGEAKTVNEVYQSMLKTLSNNPFDISFAALYRLHSDQTQATLCGQTPDDIGAIPTPTTIDLSEIDPWSFATVLRTQTAATIDDLAHQFGGVPVGVLSLPINQALVLPIRASGQETVVGLLVVGVNPACSLDPDYHTFFDLIAGHIATAIANAQAYEAERKQTEALLELDRAKTVFFSNVSHEFRTPLTLMLGPLENALSNPVGPTPNDRQQLETVYRNSLRLLKLVNTLLDFSRIEAGRMQAVYEPTDLAMLTADLAGMFRAAIDRAGLRLVVDCCALSAPACVDREMWEKIVLNLLSNAFKFTFEGEITVALRDYPDRIELEIRDTGTGIPANDLPHIFERFHRVQGARGRTYEGSGIGLSLVQELVGLHGGTIQVSSVVDQGTRFTVSIPTGCAHLPSQRIGAARTLTSTAIGAMPYVEEILRWLPETGKSAASLAQPLGPVDQSVQLYSGPMARILLADDNADMRDYVKRLLSQQYEVEAVTDGVAALAAVRQHRPDLLLTDVMMPGLDGFGLLRELRADPQTQELPIILLSARAGEESRIEGLEAGADDYLIKPFSARELLARVEANLKLAQLRQEATRREQVQRQAAEAAKQQLESVLSSISDQFLVLDQEWRYVYVNQRVVETVGIPKEAFLGKSIWELFADVVGSEFEIQVRRAIAEQTPAHFEYFYPTWQRWFEYHAYPSPEGITIFVTDITDRKQAQELVVRTAAMDAFRVSLADLLRPLADPVEMQAAASRLLGERLGANRVAYFEVRGADYVVERDYVIGAVPLMGSYPVASFGPTLLAAYRSGRAVSSSDVTTDAYLSPDQRSAYAAIQIGAYIGIPLLKNGEFVAGLAVHSREPRNWTPDDIALAEETAERTWAAVERARAEAALRQTSAELEQQLQKFNAVMSSVPDFIYMFDLSGRFIEVNQPLLDLLQKPFAEVIGKTFFELDYPVDLAAKLQAQIQEVIQTRQLLKDETQFESAFGTGIYEYIFAPIFDPEGAVTMVAGVTRDITELKQAELTLRESETRLRFMLDASQIGEWDLDLTTQPHTAHRSLRHDQIFGYQALLPEWSYEIFLTHVHPDDRDSVNQKFQQTISASTDWNFECRIIHPDQSLHWIWARSSVYCDASGTPTRLLGMVVDITDRKQVEASLQISEERLRLATEAADIGMWFWNLIEDQLVWTTYCKELFGLDPDTEMSYERFLEALHPDDRDRTHAAVQQAIDHKQEYAIEYRTLWGDGSTHWILAKGRAFYNEQGEPIRMMGIAQEITDRKQAEVALQSQAQELSQINAQLIQTTALVNQRNQELDQFAHVVSHDLKAPLRAISNLSQWIEEDLADQVPLDTKQNLSLLRSRVSRMEGLINGLLTYARIGYQAEPDQQFALNELLLEIVDSLDVPPQFTVQIPPNLPKITTNRLLLSQVFSNLISNAVKHHDRPDGQVQITAQVQADRYEFAVSDNGPGIAPKNHSKVFDIFQTLTSQDNKESTGIGLAIIKKIIERIGGQIYLKSELGQGATFKFTWPISELEQS